MSLPEYLGALALLAALLAAVAGGAAFVRRSKALDSFRAAFSLPKRSLTVMSAVALDARTRLVVVRDGEREHLIVVGQARLLETRPARDREVA